MSSNDCCRPADITRDRELPRERVLGSGCPFARPRAKPLLAGTSRECANDDAHREHDTKGDQIPGSLMFSVKRGSVKR